MKAVTVVAALCATLAQSNAHADTFQASIVGSGFHLTESADDPVDWTGTVTVVTDGSADGTYTGGTLESITVATNVFDWSFVKGQTQTAWQARPDLVLLVGPEPGASVAVAGGRLVGVDLVFDDEFNIDTMSGSALSAQTVCRTNDCHGAPDVWFVSGSITPLASVPEPRPAWMLVAGLAVAGAFARRRHA